MPICFNLPLHHCVDLLHTAPLPLHAAGSRVERRKTHHVISQMVMEVHLTGDLGIGHQHDVEAVKMDLPYGLIKAKALAIADDVDTQG